MKNMREENHMVQHSYPLLENTLNNGIQKPRYNTSLNFGICVSILASQGLKNMKTYKLQFGASAKHTVVEVSTVIPNEST